MVLVNVGTANAVCAMMNAYRERIPLVVAAGRTPFTETGQRGSRSLFIHWAQEMFDQASLVRETVKWDYEVRMPEQINAALDRAFSLATSDPRGPVYLTLPREVLSAPVRADAPSGNPQKALRPAMADQSRSQPCGGCGIGRARGALFPPGRQPRAEIALSAYRSSDAPRLFARPFRQECRRHHGARMRCAVDP